MPAYEAQATIKDSINSIINQTYKNWELLIVDDFSSDNTEIICTKFCTNDSRIKFIKLEENSGGPARPRNIGIKSAKGNIISFCDSDDIWNFEKLEMQIKAYETRKIENTLICSKRIKFYDLDSFEFPEIKNQGMREIKSSEVLRSNGIMLSSVMVAKTTLVECNYFDEDKNLIAVEDYDMWLKIIQSGKEVIFLKDPLIGYRVSDSSLSANKFKRLEKFKCVYRNYYLRCNRRHLIGLKSNIRVLLYVLIWMFKKLY